MEKETLYNAVDEIEAVLGTEMTLIELCKNLDADTLEKTLVEIIIKHDLENPFDLQEK